MNLTAPPLSRDIDEDTTSERRIAGWSALGFATCVITTNVIIGVQPDRNAGADEVRRYVVGHRGELAASVALFAVATICMLAFTSAFQQRLRRATRGVDRVWASMGIRSATLIVPLFAIVMVLRATLVAASDEYIDDPAIIAALWRLEMSAFSINTLSIAGALIGLGIAGARAGFIPRWLGAWAPVAAGIGVVGSAATVAGLEGSPVGLIGIVPFATWMVFLLVVGTRQLRRAG